MIGKRDQFWGISCTVYVHTHTWSFKGLFSGLRELSVDCEGLYKKPLDHVLILNQQYQSTEGSYCFWS